MTSSAVSISAHAYLSNNTFFYNRQLCISYGCCMNLEQFTTWHRVVTIIVCPQTSSQDHSLPAQPCLTKTIYFLCATNASCRFIFLSVRCSCSLLILYHLNYFFHNNNYMWGMTASWLPQIEWYCHHRQLLIRRPINQMRPICGEGMEGDRQQGWTGHLLAVAVARLATNQK